MTEDQLGYVETRKPFDLPVALTAGTFSENYEDRTLLYGYDCDRKTWHLYTSDANVYLHIYDGVENVTIEHVNLSRAAPRRSELQARIIPNKRLYPERCDFDFCVWAKMEGLHLSFTTHDGSLAELNSLGYYGKV
jgi:hypothetical protein